MDSLSSSSKFFALLFLIVQLGCNGASAKSLFQDSEAQPPQIQYNRDYIQQNSGNSGMSYPPFPGMNVNVEEQQSDMAHDEDIMPVKNSQFVPVESSSEESPEDGDNMYIPQRQVALNLNKYWNNNGGHYQPSKYEEVEDEGDGLIEEVVTEYAPVKDVPQKQAPTPTAAPAPATKVNKPYESKLIVESRKVGNRRIAVLVDDMMRSRQQRSMMTLSREDENDSEYDDLDSSLPKNSTQVSTTSTSKP